MIFSVPSALSDRLQRMPIATKLWSSMTLALLSGLILIAIAFSADQRSFTEQQLNSIGRIISQQTAASSAPLLLADDQLSLTINLQQLVDLPQIDGVEILATDGKIRLQLGHSSTLTLHQPIIAETTTLGTLQIHLNPLTGNYQLAQSLPLTLTASALALLLILAAIWLFKRQLNPTPTPLPTTTTATHADNHAIAATVESLATTESLDAKPASLDEMEKSADSLVSHTIDDEIEQIPTEPSQEHDPAVSSQAEPCDDQITVLPPAKTASSLASSSNNLETTNPQQGYLLYANHHVGGSDTLTNNERQQLLVRYRKSLQQVARLYKGEMSEDPLGNWCVRFSPLSNDHSHGINALCAAQLFNALYRGINTQAIRSFSPALNIKLVLLCGKLDSFDALAEDALLLSDRIQANDLITHQALYQTQPLQERLLGNAQYRKHDDDTYLVSALNNDYQTLINRQAEHFLKQLS